MIKLTETGRRILRAIFRGVGAVTAVSLGCLTGCMYGPAPDDGDDVAIRGYVASKEKVPIPGIVVSEVNNSYQYKTEKDGFFFIRAQTADSYTIIFDDIDGPKNGGEFKQYTLVKTHEEVVTEGTFSVELELINDDD